MNKLKNSLSALRIVSKVSNIASKPVSQITKFSYKIGKEEDDEKNLKSIINIVQFYYKILAFDVCESMMEYYLSQETIVPLSMINNQPFHLPCLLDKYKFLNWMLDYGVRINEPFNYHQDDELLFRVCCCTNSWNCAKVLYYFSLKQKDPINIHIFGDQTLEISTFLGNQESLKLLCDLCREREEKIDLIKFVKIGVEQDQLQCVTYLLDQFELDQDNITENQLIKKAFDYSISHGSLRMVKRLRFLLKKIDEPMIFNPDSVANCCARGEMDTIKWVYHQMGSQAFKNIMLPDRNWYLFRRAGSNGHLKLAKWMVKKNKKIDLHANDEEVFCLACANGSLKTAQWIYKKSLQQKNPVNVRARQDMAYRHSWANGWANVTEWLYPFSEDYAVEINDESCVVKAFVIDDMKRALTILEDSNYSIRKALDYLRIDFNADLIPEEEFKGCIVCLNESNDNFSVRLGCTHDYCLICLLRWFDENPLKERVCPCCKQLVEWKKLRLIEPKEDDFFNMCQIYCDHCGEIEWDLVDDCDCSSCCDDDSEDIKTKSVM